jgi:hypothetical protein
MGVPQCSVSDGSCCGMRQHRYPKQGGVMPPPLSGALAVQHRRVLPHLATAWRCAATGCCRAPAPAAGRTPVLFGTSSRPKMAVNACHQQDTKTNFGHWRPSPSLSFPRAARVCTNPVSSRSLLGLFADFLWPHPRFRRFLLLLAARAVPSRRHLPLPEPPPPGRRGGLAARGRQPSRASLPGNLNLLPDPVGRGDVFLGLPEVSALSFQFLSRM